MYFPNNLSFGSKRRLRIILQSEANECGLACVAMVANFYRYELDLTGIRRRFPTSLKGATLASIMKVAEKLGLGTRALKLELDDLVKLRVPCILHWNFNHFVVLKEVSSKCITVYDPAFGSRCLSWSEVSNAFTGIALELWPSPEFVPQKERRSLKIYSLTGHVTGVFNSLFQILVFATLLEMLAVISPFYLQWVLDNVITSYDKDLLTTLAIGFGLLVVVQQVIVIVRAWAVLYLSTTASMQWRANVFAHLLRLPIQYFERRHLGDIVSRFGSTDQIQHTLTISFIEAILDGIMSLITLSMMLFYNATLGLIALVSMLSYVVCRWAWYHPLRCATEEQIVHTARYQSHFLETIRGVKSIKMFQRQAKRHTTWLTLVVEQMNADARVQKLQFLFKASNGLLFGIENIVIIWSGASFVLNGSFTVGLLMAFLAYKNQFDSRVSAFVDKIFEFKMLRLQTERLSDIVLSEPEDAGLEMTAEIFLTTPSISVKGLSYRYAEHEPYILEDFNMDIDPGESVAIVGPSGCGKTTLINLLLGILSPSNGQILIGGISLKKIGADNFRNIVGTVLQDDVLFAGSVSDNISFFDENSDEAQILECARLAAVYDEIMAMPMGFNTLVGDMGTVLSGGQKQRVLLARALYKRPRILFLDEATSHLDIEKERTVNNAIGMLNITRIIIAHRPETIASADRIIDVKAGGVTTNLVQSDNVNDAGTFLGIF
jgi:ATP-binding cassette subfamily B protein RaxB